MDNTILIVDDEQSILSAIKRMLMDENFELLTCDTPVEALNLVAENEVAVILTDCLMPVMNGISLMQKVSELSPDTVKIMMTGYADLPLAIESINKCDVFRFIAKPWNDEQMLEALHAGVENYAYRKKARLSEDAKLLSLAQTVELKDPYTRGHCERVSDYALSLARELGLSKKIQHDIKIGSWLHDCGKIGVPDAILNSEDPLTSDEREIIDKHASWGADIARQAMLSDVVVDIIRHHHTRFDGHMSEIRGLDIPLEARIVAIGDVYDALVTSRPYRESLGFEKAREVMQEMAGSVLDPELVELFFEIQDSKDGEQ